ncbi:hypothetical protein ACJX0J_005325, partial [Zea mays]
MLDPTLLPNFIGGTLLRHFFHGHMHDLLAKTLYCLKLSYNLIKYWRSVYIFVIWLESKLCMY